MVVAPGVVEVVCFYGFNPTPINLIKKRKYLRLKIDYFDVYWRASCGSGSGSVHDASACLPTLCQQLQVEGVELTTHYG
ncbi:hypothetical protein [Pseudomonas putida]|uniref:hypothetical protein n=1 Tax=Pseudomonas putida TaxID=303 RepID=UPI0018AB0BCC|nr:hypothetical protein [Pseudomonas putida]MBF8670079.1 hypothetical protein [Pseudomonas putida]